VTFLEAVAVFLEGAEGPFFVTDLREAGFFDAFLRADLTDFLTVLEEGFRAEMTFLTAGVEVTGLANLTLPLTPFGRAKIPFSAPILMALLR